MTTPAKLYGKDLSVYDDIDVDELLNKLTAEEISALAKEVDPDVSIANLGQDLVDLVLIIVNKYELNFYNNSTLDFQIYILYKKGN